MELMEGQMARALDLRTVSTKLHQIAELDRPAGARRPTAAQRIHEPEEPDAGILHVRICEGPGRETARVYSTPIQDRLSSQIRLTISRAFGQVSVVNPSYSSGTS